MSEATDLAAAASGTDSRVGLRAALALRRLAERLEALQVTNARRQGWSWQEIADALRTVGIDLDAVLARIEESFGPGALDVPPQPGRQWGRIPFTKRARKVLGLAVREAVHLRHHYIGTEHILLGLIREGDGLAAKVLVDGGYHLGGLRTAALTALRRAA